MSTAAHTIAVRSIADAAANRILRRSYNVCLGDRVKSAIPWEMTHDAQTVSKGQDGTVIGLEWDGESPHHCLVVLFDNGPHHYNFTSHDAVIGHRPRTPMNYYVGQAVHILDPKDDDAPSLLAIVQAVGEDGVDTVAVRIMRDGRGMVAHEFHPFAEVRHAKTMH